MKILKKSKTKKAIGILKVNELLKIRGGDEKSPGAGALKSGDID